MSDLVDLLVLLGGKGSLVALAGWGACALMSRASASARHLVWTATLCGLLVLPVLAAMAPTVALPFLPQGSRSQQSQQNQQSQGTVGSVTGGALDSGMARQATVTDRFAIGVMPEAVDSSAIEGIPNPFPWVVAIYVAGFLAALGYFGAGTVAVWRLTQAAEPLPESGAWNSLVRHASRSLGTGATPRWLASRSLQAPVAWGFLEPVVLFPSKASEWTSSDLRQALLHELAHVERRDWATALLGRLACCVYWFHPLVWLAARQQELEAERACDDQVLVAGANSNDYAGQLLTLVRQVRAGAAGCAAAVSMARPSHLRVRIQSILEPQRRRHPMKPFARRLVFVLSCLPAVLMSSVILVPAEAEERPAAVREGGGTPLIRAAAAGAIEEIEELIEAGADVNQVADGENQAQGLLRTPLATASRAGHVEIVRALLDAGAEVDRAPEGDATALIEASARGHVEVVDLLLAWRADPDRLVPGDGTPLIAAARGGSRETVDRLLAAGADPGRSTLEDETPIHNAAASGNVEALEALVAAGAEVNSELPGDGSPLVVAARRRHLEAARTLLDSGANIDAAFDGDGTAMIQAAATGDTDLLRLLIERGADLDLPVEGDGNPLIVAAREGHLEAVRLLLENGAEIDRVVPGDENALIQAAGAGRLEVARFLIEQGADLNTSVVANGREVRTPLSQARRYSHTEVVELLLASGARG